MVSVYQGKVYMREATCDNGIPNKVGTRGVFVKSTIRHREEAQTVRAGSGPAVVILGS